MTNLPHGVCVKGGCIYRRFKVKDHGRWVDFYVKLPEPTDPLFRAALAKANADAMDGKYGETIAVKG